jgi:hypothetical protein
MIYTHVLNLGPGAVRSPADQLVLPKAGDIGLAGIRSPNRQGPEVRKDGKSVRFGKLE